MSKQKNQAVEDEDAPIDELADAQEQTYHKVAMALKTGWEQHRIQTQRTVASLKLEVARLQDITTKQSGEMDKLRNEWQQAQNTRQRVQRELDQGLLTNGQLYRKCLKQLEELNMKVRNLVTPERAVAPLRSEMKRMSGVLDSNKRDTNLRFQSVEKSVKALKQH